jgi:hypothetical protein
LSSKEDGTLLGFDSSGITLFCEDHKSGKHVHSMVVPGSNDLKFSDKVSDQKDNQGQIYCTFHPIKKLYYDKDRYDDDNPYLTLKIQRRLEQNKRYEMLDKGEQLQLVSVIIQLTILTFFLSQETETETDPITKEEDKQHHL